MSVVRAILGKKTSDESVVVEEQPEPDASEDNDDNDDDVSMATSTDSADTGIYHVNEAFNLDAAPMEADCSSISNFFGYCKKKLDVNSNDVHPPGFFASYFPVSEVPPSARRDDNGGHKYAIADAVASTNPLALTATAMTPAVTAADGIGNDIVKMCKNTTDDASVQRPPDTQIARKTTTTTVAAGNEDDREETEVTRSARHGSCASIVSYASATSAPNSPSLPHKSVAAASLSSPSSPRLTVRNATPRLTVSAEDICTAMGSVKPAGHGTVAIAPRIPTPSASRRNSGVTPPESPRIVEVYDDCNGVPPQFPAPDTTPSRPTRLRHALITEEPTHDDAFAKKNLVNQEVKFQTQLNDLTKQLAARDAEANKLRFQMEELQRDVFAKSAGMDRLQTELAAAQKESDNVKQRIKHLEQDLEDYRLKNGRLSVEIAKKTETFATTEKHANAKITDLERTIRELREKIASLETQLGELQMEKRALIKQHATIIEERERERRNVERQLEEAVRAKNAVAAKWQAEFEKLRTVGLLKEQSLLDDFEWQLREVHKTCKTRLAERERSLEQRLREAVRDAEVKMTVAQQMMDEVAHLHVYKEEAVALKDRSEAQAKEMRTMLDRQAEMKASEEELRKEAKRLRSLIDLEKENLQHMQRVHHQELVDKERWLQTTLQEKKTEIAEYWEERLLHEIGRLKWELEQLYLEEKQSAIADVQGKKEMEYDEARKLWEYKINECLKEIKDLKKTLDEKESFYQNELMAQQTNSDREIFEFRRIMDKIDNAHHERFEKLSQDHELELEKLTVQFSDKLGEMEMSHKVQTSSLRASLILLKDQMEKEAQQQINDLIAQHRSELDTQWANLVHQKSAAIKLLENDYVHKIKTLEEQFNTQQKSHESREIELLKTIDTLKNDVLTKDATIDDMQSNVDTLEGGVQVLNQEIAQQSDQLMRNRRDADQKIRGLQDVLMKLQALADQERDEFQAKLAQQQKQAQQQSEHLQKKVVTLTKLFEEVRSRYERRESRQEDLNLIADLRQVIAEQEKDLTCINEEKRYYQMQLMHLQRDADGSYEEGDDDEFVVVEELQADDHADYTVTFPGEAPAPAINNPPAQRPKLTTGTCNLVIPPTIPECDDCEEDA